jgi:hypothetical protein
MENQQDRTPFATSPADQLPWHRPVFQRLEINTETRFGGESFDDGDGLGLIAQDAGG